jgi:putative phosphoribosyl transferase
MRVSEIASLQTAVRIPHGALHLPGELRMPAGAAGVVLFAHGSGSSRHSPRNRAVADALQQRGVGTLLFDLLTEAEENQEFSTHHLRFDIPLLADRLGTATDWLRGQENAAGLPLAYFGASTGAAAALVSAAVHEKEICAVVSRGGRPDLAGDFLARVKAPTLLIVGGNDEAVLRLNKGARDQLRCQHALAVIPGASHLFEEPGALDEVARLAADFFLKQFQRHGKECL